MPDLASGDGTGVGAAGGVAVQEATRRSRKRRASTDDGGDEDAKPTGAKNEYECRFCLMKFEKSQALGGHMNRHRQEREKEQFQHAQQIVSSVVQQQMPRTWSSLSAEMIESPSVPNGNGVSSRLVSHLSGDATRQQFVTPPISFGTSYRPTSPANRNPGTQLPPSPGSNSNYYVPANASSCNVPGNSNNNQHHQLQLQQWIGSIDGFSNAASNSNSPSSVSFRHHPVENSMAISLQAAAGVPSELLANMLRNSSTPTDGSPMHVSPGTPTSSQAPGTYDVIYNSQLANAFYNGGM